jgi:hypothetical protein
MPTAQAAIDSFLRAIEASPPLWRSVHLRTLAVRVEGTWRNVVTRGRLDPRAPDDVPRVETLAPRGALAGWEQVLPFDALADLLDPLLEGEMRVNGTRVLFWRDDPAHEEGDADDAPPPEGGPYTGSCRTVDVSRDPFGSRSGWSEHALDLSGGPISALLNGASPRQLGMDRALEALRRPRGDLAGWARLAQDVLAPGSERCASLELVAPLQARLDADGCSLALRCARVALAIGSDEVLPHVSLEVVPGGTDAPDAVVRAEADAGAWVRDGRVAVLRRPLAVPAAEGELVLRVGGVRVDARPLRDGSTRERMARVAAYAVFDPGMEHLRASLLPLFPSQAAEFDTAVPRLLGLAGLRVDPPAGPRRLAPSGGAVVAWAGDAGVALLVECSAGMVGGDVRLERLRERAARVGEAVGRPALPVVATALDRARLTAAERARAAALGIALLGREELDRILRMCLDGESEREVVAYIASYAAPAPGSEWTGPHYADGSDDEQVPLPL